MEYELSEYQKKIKTYFITHPHNNMAIEALAGCAKSFTALMLTNLTKTSDVYIAFNKSIQMEMKEKLTNPKTKCYTMHGLALSVMSYNLSKIKKEYKLDNFKTIKSVDKLFEKYYKGTKKYSTDMKLYLEENYFILYNLIRLKSLSIDVDNVEYLINENAIFQDAENCIPPLTSEITDWLQELDIISKNEFEENCICDFTDMLYITKGKLSTGEWEVPYWLLFTNITIDESQDLSRLQYTLLPFFKRKGGRYIFIYDKNQAIYGFSGADCNATQNIERIFAPITKFELPINYRCGSKILAKVNSLYSIGIKPRPNANEGKVIIIGYNEISNYIQPDDFVLGRTNKQLVEVALELIKKGVPIYLTDKEIVNSIIKFIRSLQEVNTVEDLKKRADNFIRKYNKIENQSEKNKKQDIFEKYNIVKLLIKSYKSSKNTSENIIVFINYIKEVINTESPKDCVRIMSIHKSKGLEADNVFCLSKAQPFYSLARSKDMMAQEKNLSYVAMTRAKENLYLVEDKIENKGEKQ